MSIGGALSGKQILVVEDEYFIASDLRKALQTAGAQIVGPVPDLRSGLQLAQEGAIDAALLDVHLGETRSYAIADHLVSRSVPYILLTGYDEGSLPEAYRGAPRIEKPFEVSDVVDQLARLVESGVP